MSTLTKVLIVLLSLSTIFLSGTMVTFVATTDNFKELAKNQAEEIKAYQDETALHDQRLQEKSSQTDQERKLLQTRIQKLQAQLSTSEVNRQIAETAKNDLQIKFNTMNGILAGLESTLKNETATRALTQDQLDKQLAKVIKLQAELNIIEADQSEKIVNIQKLNAKVKNLTEAKSMYDDQIAQMSTSGKKVNLEDRVVTRVPDYANEALAAPTNTALKGLVSGISANLELVTISLGSADGVARNSVFHVTRGDEFICNVKITNVDTNKSAGVIELQIGQPRIGDTVSNEL
ncbi:MAG: hypothetical protein K9M75_12750 [Phycisphaerae bacterium]|nr:hypothetical protein [Phycisphaerae bacterium]